MSKDNVDVSSDLGSLLGELAKAKAEEQKKKQEKVEELNKDSSFANMMAELSQVAKVTKVKGTKVKSSYLGLFDVILDGDYFIQNQRKKLCRMKVE